jgi:hypothetical protein
MIRRMVLVAVLASAMAAAAGCQSQRAKFDQVYPGMNRCAVLCTMGLPLDEARTFMHWSHGEYTDAWVFFSANGWRVTGKYWEDPGTLRLDEIVPLMSEGPEAAPEVVPKVAKKK